MCLSTRKFNFKIFLEKVNFAGAKFGSNKITELLANLESSDPSCEDVH